MPLLLFLILLLPLSLPLPLLLSLLLFLILLLLLPLLFFPLSEHITKPSSKKWIACSKYSAKFALPTFTVIPVKAAPDVEVVPTPEPKDHYDAILEMVTAESRKKEKLSAILNALNPVPEKKG